MMTTERCTAQPRNCARRDRQSSTTSFFWRKYTHSQRSEGSENAAEDSPEKKMIGKDLRKKQQLGSQEYGLRTGTLCGIIRAARYEAPKGFCGQFAYQEHLKGFYEQYRSAALGVWSREGLEQEERNGDVKERPCDQTITGGAVNYKLAAWAPPFTGLLRWSSVLGAVKEVQGRGNPARCICQKRIAAYPAHFALHNNLPRASNRCESVHRAARGVDEEE
ncbi:hypothetical protein C8R45DRAFT_1078857 [Mycena sanguinolenta]|nr:hypothetical protein C8R45DRAFT_1078857 [Mycena sanguinolenta]